MSIFEEKITNANTYDKKDALSNIRALYSMWKSGKLGGEIMPEDSNPNLALDEEQNYIYFTLPMALNYQRNSYKLWESALKTYDDPYTRYLFNPQEVICKDVQQIQNDLVKYKVALQPNKQTVIWITLCNTIVNHLEGSIKNLFIKNDYSVKKILQDIQFTNKKDYPYLSGNKIANYWLYVLLNYTSLQLVDKKNISVAPDTHVIQSTHKLGLIDNIETHNVQEQTAKAWEEVLTGSEFTPIDIHTPMWLWSRSGFPPIN